MSTKNMDILNKLLIFAAGIAIGSAVTWNYLTRVQEEEFYEDEEEESESKKWNELGECFQKGFEDGLKEVDEKCKKTAQDICEKHNYASYSKSENKEEDDDMNKPYVIPPEEFDDNDYETESLTLYADGVLVNVYGNPIEDVDRLVGKESLTHFGEYEDDSVFVRNDELKTDFEILLDTRRYHDLTEEE